MAAPYRVHAKEDRRFGFFRAGEGMDIPFLLILLVVFLVDFPCFTRQAMPKVNTTPDIPIPPDTLSSKVPAV